MSATSFSQRVGLFLKVPFLALFKFVISFKMSLRETLSIETYQKE